MKNFMLNLRSFFGFAVIAVVTPVIATLVTILCFFEERVYNYLVNEVWSGIVLWTAGVDLEVRGVEKLDPSASYIFVSNHQSHLDIVSYFKALPQNIRFIAKRSLLYVPFFGLGMWSMGHVLIDRSNKKKSFESIEKAAEKIRGGTSVFIFAEGTRTADRSIGPFKKGGLFLAVKSGVPIVPCAINGTFDVLPRGFHFFRPHRVVISIGKPIETRNYSLGDKDKLMDEVRRAVIENFIPLPDSEALAPDGSPVVGEVS